ncbi:MAG: hypothetical protein WA718_00590 [Terriglobales bacterium]
MAREALDAVGRILADDILVRIVTGARNGVLLKQENLSVCGKSLQFGQFVVESLSQSCFIALARPIPRDQKGTRLTRQIFSFINSERNGNCALYKHQGVRA